MTPLAPAVSAYEACRNKVSGGRGGARDVTEAAEEIAGIGRIGEIVGRSHRRVAHDRLGEDVQPHRQHGRHEDVRAHVPLALVAQHRLAQVRLEHLAWGAGGAAGGGTAGRNGHGGGGETPGVKEVEAGPGGGAPAAGPTAAA